MSFAQAECFVWGALALTLRVSRLVGVAPLRMTRERAGWRVSVSPALCLYSYFVLFILHACILGGLAIDLTLNYDRGVRARSMIVIMAWVIELTFTLTIVTLGVLSSRTRLDQMVKCLNIIEKIHVKLNKTIATSSVENKRYIVAIVYLLLLNIQQFADFGMFLYVAIKDGRSVIVVCLYSCYYLEYLITLLLEMQYAFLALLVNSTLKFINDSLDNISLQTVTNTSNTYSTIYLAVKPCNILIFETAQEKIQQLNLSFGAICDIINRVNENYGTILFLLLGSFFLHLFEAPYFFVLFIFSAHSEIKLYRLALQVSYCLLHLSFLILAVEPGHRTEKEVDRTEVLISQLLRRVSSNDNLARELDLFYKKITLSNVSYSPLGIFILNRPLITAICGGVTTYLVIVFQFQAMDLKL